MRLTPTERDRLLLFNAAQLARRRRERGVRLNVPEATAIIADAVIESARDGQRLAVALQAGQQALGPADVLPGVADLLAEVRVEAVFDDGSRLVVVPDPIGAGQLGDDAPGAVLTEDGEVEVDSSEDIDLRVTNTADVPISVTSHFHFFEVNPRLSFDRAAAYGYHLAVDAGTAVRFEPGRATDVRVRPIGGSRVVIGFAGLVDGPLDAPGAKDRALAKAAATGYLSSGEPA